MIRPASASRAAAGSHRRASPDGQPLAPENAFTAGMTPEVAVIILNFNGLADTRRALESLRRASSVSLLPIVIDNGSTNDEALELQAEFPEAVVERLEENLGVSRGINYASRIAIASRAPYILLLNNDAWLEKPDLVLSRLIAALSSNPSLGAAGPLIVEDDESGRVQSAGYRFSLWCPLPRAVRRTKTSGFTYLSGCCLLIPAATFVELEGFDPDFFLYGEDVDFGLRMTQSGRTMALVGDMSVRHKRGASSHLLSTRYVYNALRGNLIVTLKHARWYQMPTAVVSSIVITLGLTVIAKRSGTRYAGRAALKAWIDFIRRRWGGLEGRPLTPAERPRAATGLQSLQRLINEKANGYGPDGVSKNEA
jgi:GT2 family glycosyltransferase